MNDRRQAARGAIALGLVLLVVALVLATSRPVTLRTWMGAGAPAGTLVGCYLSGIDGTLVPDAEDGTALIEEAGPASGQRSAISWPDGYWGLSVLGTTLVFDGHGPLPIARTGTRVHLPGGYHGGAFEACFQGVTSLG